MKKQKEKKEKRRKPKYGVFSCVKYMYGLLWKYERSLTYVGVLTVPLSLILTAIGLYTPTIVLLFLEKANVFSTVALIISGLLLSEMLFNLINNVVGSKIAWSEHSILMRMMYILECQRLDEDYYLEYSPDNQLLYERAERSVGNNHSAGVHFPMDFSGMLSTLLRFLLFGAVISLLNPIIILLLLLGNLINYIAINWERKRNYETEDQRNVLYRKLNYLSFRLSRDNRFGKDIRLYSLKDYLSELAIRLKKAIKGEREKTERRSLTVAIVSFLVVFVRDGAAYAFLIVQAVEGRVDAASFVLYFSAITSMSGVFSDILNSISRVSEGAHQISDFRERLEVKGKHNRGEGIPLPKGAFSVEFKNVTYKYPEGEKNVLENISFKIEAGERIALVGLNGAGKTTLTKLMCGLLIPDEGEVLLDGRSIFEYNRDEMYSLFSLVPQYYNLFPFSIARNITLTTDEETINEEKLKNCIEFSGLSEKIDLLPEREQTPLNRQVNKNGIELSGGETQRLLLARVLYNKKSCIILDEPTAALDPIAEDRMYRKYNEIAGGSTAIFISHRLASTRFCHRIFLLDGATLAEVGDHEELMAKGGKYRELFDIQSRYYKEGEKANEEG